MWKKIVASIFCALLFVVTNQASANSSDNCFLFKVNVWSLEKLPPELVERLKVTIADGQDRSIYAKLPRKHGKELREGADGTLPNISCDDIRSGKADDTSKTNTGKWSRYTEPVTVTITYKDGLFAEKITAEEKTVNGVARFYIPCACYVEARVEAPADGKKVLSPVHDFINFEAKEWGKDTVNSTHVVVE